MIPDWNNLYDRFKDRRYGMLFLLAPLAICPLLINLVSGLRHGFFQRREPPERYRLSSDERVKARSKLINSRKPARMSPATPVWIEG